MGQASSSETLSISGGDGYQYWVGLVMKPIDTGTKKTVFKGVLMGHGPRQWEKVIAKSFTKIPGTKDSWTHEVKKSDITKQLAHKFVQTHSLGCKIKIVVPGIVQMDRVSNIDKWLSAKNKYRGLNKDEWISVEEFIPGTFYRYCPWRAKGTGVVNESEQLQVFSHFTYKHSNGTLVACDFQGVCVEKNSTKKYTVTDCIIHSSHKLFGIFDQGEYGIKEFFKFHNCTSACKDWPLPTPLTPPPSFEEACAQQLNLSPPFAFENIIFHSDSSEMVDTDSGLSQGNQLQNIGRRRHASDHQRRRRREGERTANTLSVDAYQQRRRSHGSIGDTQSQARIAGRNYISLSPSHDNLLGAVGSDDGQLPSYSSVCAQESQTDLSETDVKCPAESISPSPCRPEMTESYNSQPPAYDSVVDGKTDSNSVTNAEHETLRRVRSASERRVLFERTGQVHPSSSDPLCDLSQMGSRNQSWSDNCSNPSPLRQRRLLSQRNGSAGRKDDSRQVFYLGDMESDLPHLVLLSAPPMPFEFENT